MELAEPQHYRPPASYGVSALSKQDLAIIVTMMLTLFGLVISVAALVVAAIAL